MKDVSAVEGSELDEDDGLVVRSELDGILLKRIMEGRRPPIGRLDLVCFEMDVDGMGPPDTAVVENLSPTALAGWAWTFIRRPVAGDSVECRTLGFLGLAGGDGSQQGGERSIKEKHRR